MLTRTGPCDIFFIKVESLNKLVFQYVEGKRQDVIIYEYAINSVSQF